MQCSKLKRNARNSLVLCSFGVVVSLTVLVVPIDTCAFDATVIERLDFPVWAQVFSESERRELHRSGCDFDEEDREAYHSLRQRGFGPQTFVLSYRKKRITSLDYPGILEEIVVLQYLGLDAERYLLSKEDPFRSMTISEYYAAKTRNPARALKLAGGILLGTSLGAALLGGVIIASGDLGGAIAGSMVIASAIPPFLAGLTMVLVGIAKTYEQPAIGILEQGHISELERFRTRRAKRRDRKRRSLARWAVYPSVGKGMLGVGFFAGF